MEQLKDKIFYFRLLAYSTMLGYTAYFTRQSYADLYTMVNLCELSLDSSLTNYPGFIFSTNTLSMFDQICYFDIGLYTKYLLGMVLGLFFIYLQSRAVEGDEDFIHTIKTKLKWI